MINTIMSIIGTGVVIGGAIGTILKGFYKTNKEATSDYLSLESKFDAKLDKLEKRLEHEFELNNQDIKKELQNISDKIDAIKTRYVTNDTFKTYVDSISKLLELSTDRMTRIESTLDDIRDDLSNIIRAQNNNIDKK